MPIRQNKTGGETPSSPEKPATRSSRGSSTSNGTQPDDTLGAMFQTLVKNVFGVIMVTANDGTIQYMTPSIKRVLGYDAHDLFGKEAHSFIHSKDINKTKAAMKSALSSKKSGEPFDVRARHWDGTFRTCQMVVQKISNGLAFSFHDVTDQRHAEDALRRSEERYRTAFQCSPNSITISELSTGRFVEVNEGFERIFGYTHDEVAGKPEMEFGIWKTEEARTETLKKLKRDGSVREFESDMVTRDNDIVHCLISAEQCELDRKQCVVMIARDITERKRYEEQLERTKWELEHEQQELTEKNIALKQILDHIEQEKSEFRGEIGGRIETLLKPVIKKLKKSGGKLHDRDIKQLENAVDNIVTHDTDRYKENLSKLTPRELDICDLIKQGYSSKEIAALLSVSLQTVHKHRQIIRRKLQMNNQDVNLAAYLRLR